MTTLLKEYQRPEELNGKCLLLWGYSIQKSSGEVKVVKEYELAHSFLLHFIKALYFRLGNTTRLFSTTRSNATQDTSNQSQIVCTGSANDDTTGILVGIGTAAVGIGDYRIQSQIIHGTGAGQLQYGACVGSTVNSTTNTTSLIFTRVFSNASGGTVTVNEIGMADYDTNVGSPSVAVYYLIARDVVSPITILNGEQLTLSYTVQTNV